MVICFYRNMACENRLCAESLSYETCLKPMTSFTSFCPFFADGKDLATRTCNVAAATPAAIVFISIYPKIGS